MCHWYAGFVCFLFSLLKFTCYTESILFSDTLQIFWGEIHKSSSIKFYSGTLKCYTGSGTFINKGFLVTENS